MTRAIAMQSLWVQAADMSLICQVETLVEDVKYARQSFSEEIRSVLDDM